MKLTKIRQRFPDTRIANIPAALKTELIHLRSELKRGDTIAVAIGSRGIADLKIIVTETIGFLKQAGVKPFIIPAMGSHGNATAKGQKQMLANLGIDEASAGVPIRSSMEVVEIPSPGIKPKVFMDKFAFEADGIVLINRIKPHTDFHGSYESGLVKMAVIGLGKHEQALELHRFGIYGLETLLPEVAKQVLGTGKILFGLGVIENARDKTAVIKGLKGEAFMSEEPGLLEMARSNLPTLPVTAIDVLMVDRIGKDISGTGMDTNVIGRTGISALQWPGGPDIKVIVVNDLTAATHGNASGMGLADIISKKLYDKINFSATYENVITSTFLQRAKIPIIAANTREAFAIALRGANAMHPESASIMRLRDTLHLEYIFVSPAILAGIADQVEAVGPAQEMFTKTGDLTDF